MYDKQITTSAGPGVPTKGNDTSNAEFIFPSYYTNIQHFGTPTTQPFSSKL